MQTDHRSSSTFAAGFTTVFLSALLFACASAPEAPPAPARPLTAMTTPTAASAPVAANLPTAPSASSSSSSTPSVNPNLKSFNDVIKDFKKTEGLFNVWTKDERYLIELRESDFNKPFYMSIHRSQGLGERGLIAGLLLDGDIVTLRRAPGDRVQLFQRNTRFFADGNKPMERNLAIAFPDSLVGVTNIVSQPNPTTKTVLVDAAPLLLTDLPGGGVSLEAAYRVPYALDRNNSVFAGSHNSPNETTIEILLRFALARSPVPQPGQNFALPRNVPDPRSVSLGFLLSFSALPEPMRPRVADPRVGYFQTGRWDYSDDIKPSPRVHYIKRWRLEKKDETAEVSEPKEPITFWIDRNVPERYRPAVREGVLMWNEAFERIGFKNAIVVQQQKDDADFDTMDRTHASVRWYVSTDANVSIGPSISDPRTGEILDADVVIGDVFTRGPRRSFTYDVPPRALTSQPLDELCSFAEQASDHALDSLDLLVDRGEIVPGSPEADAYVNDYLRLIVAHEVGHTLGLAHNFHASSVFTPAQLRDPSFVAANGTSASVMDYIPSNLNLRNEKPSGYFQKHLGAYDLWAIEYGYKQMEAADETTALRRIADRSRTEPWLVFANDIDAGGESFSAGVDPDVNRFDLSSDIQAWFERNLKIAHERWDWLAKRGPLDESLYALTRQSVERSLSGLTGSAQLLAKKIGGIRTNRDPGQLRPSFVTVPEREQRLALDTITRAFFASDSFRIDPALLQRLPVNHLEQFDDMSGYGGDPQLPLASIVLRSQLSVLDQMISDRTTTRLIESELLRKDEKGSLPLGELLDALQNSIWSELDHDGNIDVMRRNLQRAWLIRLTGFITRSSGSVPPDVRSLARSEAELLRNKVQRALQRKNYNAITRAHLQETATALEEALRASIIKMG